MLIPKKTEVTAFHLRNKEAKRSLKVVWNKTQLENTTHPKYPGVTLDRSLSYKQHIQNTKMNVATRNNLLTKTSNFQVGSKSKYYPNNSFTIELLYGQVCSSSLGKLSPCQEPGPRTKPNMLVSHRRLKAYKC